MRVGHTPEAQVTRYSEGTSTALRRCPAQNSNSIDSTVARLSSGMEWMNRRVVR
jgi:hypothetical protein